MDLIKWSVTNLKQVGIEMLAAARKYPLSMPQEYSNNETEMNEQFRKDDSFRRSGEFCHKHGLARAFLYQNNSIISLVISLETFESPPIYRLSMCRITGPSTYANVPEDDATLIAECFFGKAAQKVPNPSGIENAKHFICVVSDPDTGGSNNEQITSSHQ